MDITDNGADAQVLTETLDDTARRLNREAGARYRARNAEKVTEASRNCHYKRTFGITTDDYARLLEKQGGVCAICKRAETALGRGGRVKPLAIDHCHATNTIRGLLCYNCNSMIGYSMDSPVSLRAAALYLEVANTGLKAGPKYSVTESAELAADILDEIARL